MKPEIAKLWVEALRSGQYKQTRGRLRVEDQFCCMGVLCDIHAGQFGTPWRNDTYGGDKCTPPLNVMDWAGLKTDVGYMPNEKYCLTELNDTECRNFVQIAYIIEQNVEAL